MWFRWERRGGAGYSLGMTDPDLSPAPQEWLDALERSEAQLRAGLAVPLEDVLAEFDADLAAYEATRAAREEAEAHSTTP